MRHLQSFRYLRAIVNAGSIRGAAESLAISPSALNRHIQTLELDLDISLFERLSRGVRLSSEGELFYNFALGQLASYDRVRSHIAGLRGQNIGQLNVGLSQDFNTDFLHSMIADFQREMENVDLSFTWIDNDMIFDALKSRTLDMALLVNPMLRKGIKLLQAKDIPLSVQVPVGTSFVKSDTMSLHQLEGLRLALPPAQSEVSKRILAAFERNQMTPIVFYKGPHVSRYLEHSHLPVAGVEAHIDTENSTGLISGYKRYFLAERDIGTCNVCLITNEFFADTKASYRFQERLNLYLQ